MKNKTLTIIVVVLLVVLVFGMAGLADTLEDITGGVSSGAVVTTTKATTTMCNHKTHSTAGYCSNCGVNVGHSYIERGVGATHVIDTEEHIIRYYCSCGQSKSSSEACVKINNVCVYCGYDYSCKHTTHINDAGHAICKDCGAEVSHEEQISYNSNGDGTHYLDYGCAGECGYGGRVDAIACTYENGKCVDCGASQ